MFVLNFTFSSSFIVKFIMSAFDVVIIGGGLAGLYAARRFLLETPLQRVAIFEKDTVLGGRTKESCFSGSRIVTGAGIARKHKDRRLLSLMQALELPPPPTFRVKHNLELLPPFSCDVQKSFEKVRDAYTALAGPKPPVTFKAFAVATLGPAKYRSLVLCMGYSDFECDDVSQVLYHYGAEDNYTEWSAVAVPWAELVRALRSDIVKRHGTIKQGWQVESIAPSWSSSGVKTYTLSAVGGRTRASYEADVLVLATDITGIRELLPGFSLYQGIHGQAFLRLYVKFEPRSAAIVSACISRGVTMVRGPLQKILPIEKHAGVYMIAYCDNDNARAVARIMNNTSGNRRAVSALVQRALQLPTARLQIESMRGFYFKNGTHYYDPVQNAPMARLSFLARAQRPLRNVFVVGEVVALHQGWVEGALESVDAIFL